MRVRRAGSIREAVEGPTSRARQLLWITILGAVLILAVACDRADSPNAEQTFADRLPILGTLPPFSLIDQSGAKFDSAELRDEVWIADFIFTTCPGVCPLLTERMKGVQEKLAAREDLRLVSFTVDPEHDTPTVLSEYAANQGADESRWYFLTGEREDLWRISREGFKLPVEENIPEAPILIVHSQQLVLIDRVGRIRGYYDGLEDEETAKLVADAEAVLGEPRPVAVPASIMDPPWLEKRRQQQLAAAADYTVAHDFQFSDNRGPSGITFRHRFVGDLGKDFKSTHYDHGNGVAIADVDGDERLDLYFTTQLGSNELWKNMGGGRFTNITPGSGIALADRISVAPAFGDIDNDGDPDLFVSTVRGGNTLFENDGKGRFRDISAEAGIDHVGHSSGAVFLDYDRDGLLDLFVTNVGRYTTEQKAPDGYWISYEVTFDGHVKPDRFETSILYRNAGDNRFEDVTEQTGVVEDGWNGDPHATDFNADGFPDLYLINMQGHDSYFENVNGRKFEDRSRELFPSTPFGSMGISIFDFDNDGRMDIYIVDMHTDMFSSTMFTEYIEGLEDQKLPEEEKPSLSYLNTDGNHVLGNAFFLQGDDGFVEVSDRIGAETYWPWGLSHGDLNADGWEDVFITSSMNYPFRYQVNRVQLNDRGKRFLDSEFVLGIEPRRNHRTATPWFTLDCAGEDLFHRECEGRDEAIEVWAAVGSRSSVIFDLDDDGDLDIVTNDFGSEPLVLVSDLAQKHDIRYLKVRLRGSTSNRSGLGARVTVRAAGREYVRVHDGKTGYLAHSAGLLYFGLGRAEAAEWVEVLWPSGERQRQQGPIELNRTIEIAEP